MVETKICSTCGGATEVGGLLCVACMGTGGAHLAGVPRFLKEHVTDMEDKLDDIIDKLNDIKEVVDAL